MKYRTSLYDEDFSEKISAFTEECCRCDTHDNLKMISMIHRANEIFNTDGQDTRDAVIGGLIVKMAYYKQKMDGTHEEFSSHED
mgnify:CR=1 FL=1|tara:strand:+ start:1166 stop:1417 length:252 start_codon:yes stop_codon:yes gene_type:complete